MEWSEFKDLYVDVNDVYGHTIKTRYWDIQKSNEHGQTIVFLHGIGNSIEIGTPIIKPLVELGYRFVAVDFPGHGKTELCKDNQVYTNEGFPKFVYQFIKVLGLNIPVVLLAHSLGGIAAARLSAEHPEYVDKLIMIDPGGFSRNVALQFKIGSNPIMGLLGMTDFILNRTTDKRIKNLPQSEYISPEYVRLDAYYLKRTKGQAVRWLLRNEIGLLSGYPRYLNKELLSHITAPTLLIWGLRDKTIPVEDSKNALVGIDNSRLIIFRDAGHRPHVSHTSETVKLFSEFIETGYLQEEKSEGRIIYR